jgi:hypothetical protein
MKLYFDWIDENEDFNPSVHGSNDGQIFSFLLTEKEGSFPLMTIEVLNPYLSMDKPFQKQWCYVSFDRGSGKELLFKGKVLSVPHHIRKQTVALNFIAQPHDWEDQLQILHHTLKNSGLWDPLFVSEEDQDDPIESLEARSELFFWCRTTGRVKLTDLFWGAHQIDLSEQHFYDDLQIRMSEIPLNSVHVFLSAEWIQKYQGETNLFPLIKAYFPEGLINTLTGKDLQAKWWQTDEKIGRSGYWVYKSSLKEVTPYHTGDLNLYPSFSVPFWTSPEDPIYGQDKPSDPQQKRLKRTWFQGDLIVRWNYRQKRSEKAYFTLNHAIQLPPSYGKKTRKISLKLQNISEREKIPEWQPQWGYSKGFRAYYQGKIYLCIRKHRSSLDFEDDKIYWHDIGLKKKDSFSSNQGRFFTTDRGKKAIEHAVEIARAHLASSARAIEISLKGPIDNFVDLTCDHSIRIKDKRLPGEKVWGKVKSIRLNIDGQTGKQWGEAVLGVSIGSKEEGRKEDSLEMASYGFDYNEADYQANILRGHSFSGIEYKIIQEQEPQEHLLYPQSLTAKDLVQELKITNTATQQNLHLLQDQYPKTHNIEAILKEIPTTIHIKLLDLKPLENFKKYIEVDILSAWTPPSQIDLKTS